MGTEGAHFLLEKLFAKILVIANGTCAVRDLTFCHYECDEVIQIQVLLANRLLHSFRVRNDMFRGVIANAVRRSVGKQIASSTPQMWIVAGSHLGFAKKSFHSIAMTRIAGQV